MRCTPVIGASLSPIVFMTKQSFQKQLNVLPTTAFHYYCELQPDHQVHNDPQYKKFMRREWEMLSVTKKRFYYAFYFHFKGIDYRNMNKFELARFLEVPTPATSEYMLFRNTFKYKFDIAWIEGLKRQRTTGRGQLVKHALIAGGHRLMIYAQLDHRQLQQETTNYTRRYQQMCRECRRVWKEKLTVGQKTVVRAKWEEQRQAFEDRIRCEVKALELNLNKLMQVELRNECLIVEESCEESLKKK